MENRKGLFRYEISQKRKDWWCFDREFFLLIGKK